MTTIRDLNCALSDVLTLIRMRAESIASNDYDGDWSTALRGPHAHFHVIDRGAASLQLGSRPALVLREGDVVFLPRGARHALRAAPSGSRRATIITGQYSHAGVIAPRLLRALPSVFVSHVGAGAPRDLLRLNSHYMVDEANRREPGCAIMISRLMELLFIQSIRQWGSAGRRHVGWVAGIADPAIGSALAAIHERPAEPWTVAALAAIAGHSRSAFAARFSDVVGQSPLRYLTAWRLSLAAENLTAGSAPIADIAALVDYGSEAALSRAFSATFHMTPARFRRTHARPAHLP
jgi:AraC-like DNA-binding protein